MRKIGFQLWSANLVLAFIRVFQAQIFGCACLKRKWRDIGWNIAWAWETPKGGARLIFWGPRQYFTVHSDWSQNTYFINFQKKYCPSLELEVLILCIAFAAGAIFSRIDPALLGAYGHGPIKTNLYWAYTGPYTTSRAGPIQENTAQLNEQ